VLYLFLCALPIIPMGYVAHLPIAYWLQVFLFWFLNLLCGAALPFGQIPLHTLIQLETEDAYRGRVNAAMGMMAALVLPIGTAMSGFLIKWLTLPGLFVFMGVGLAAMALSGLLFKSIREAVLPTPATEDPTDDTASESTSNPEQAALDPSNA
jgi:hypothetical protein